MAGRGARLLVLKGVVALALSAALLGAVGCAGGGEEGAAAPQPTATQAPAAVAATPTPATGGAAAQPTAAPAVAKPKYGGTLRMRTYDNNPTLDPQQNLCGCITSSGVGIAYSRLLRFQGEQTPATPGATVMTSYEVAPDLAERWEVVSPTEYRFYLRKGVKWHNIPPVNGRELTADDVVFAFKRQTTPGWTNAALLGSAVSFEAVDRYTVKILLKSPDADFLVNVADGHTKIVAPEAVEAGGGTLKEGPTIGTNAWVMDRVETGVGTFFSRFADYWEKDADGNALPYADRLNMHLIRDEATRLSAFRAGQLDEHGATKEQFEVLRKEKPTFPFMRTRTMGSGQIMGLNATKPMLSDVRFRQAIFFALNPQDIRAAGLGGWGYGSVGFPTPTAKSLLTDEQLAVYVNNPAKAKQLLADAGIKTPATIDFVIANYGESYISSGEMMVAQLLAVGINAKIRIIDATTYTTKVLFGEVGFYDMFLGPIQPTPSANASLLNLYLSTGAQTTHGFKDAALDKMIMDQAGETDLAKREQMIIDIQKFLMEKALRYAPGTSESSLVWYPYLKDRNAHTGSYGYEGYNRMWFDK